MNISYKETFNDFQQTWATKTLNKIQLKLIPELASEIDFEVFSSRVINVTIDDSNIIVVYREDDRFTYYDFFQSLVDHTQYPFDELFNFKIEIQILNEEGKLLKTLDFSNKEIFISNQKINFKTDISIYLEPTVVFSFHNKI